MKPNTMDQEEEREIGVFVRVAQPIQDTSESSPISGLLNYLSQAIPMIILAILRTSVFVPKIT